MRLAQGLFRAAPGHNGSGQQQALRKMATHDVQVVQHGDHGAALLVQAAEQRHELIGGMAVHGCKGLVQQQHRCVLHQHAREQRALHLAAGQGIQAAARLGGQAHGLQRLHAAVEFLATVAAPGADPPPGAHRHQLQHRHGKTAIQLGGLRQPRQIGAARASDSQGAGHRGNTPMMPLISVDLPAPFGPTTAVMPPAAKLPETERSTGCPCQPKEIWSSSMAAPAARNPRRTRAAARRSCAPPTQRPAGQRPQAASGQRRAGHAAPCGSQDSGADKTPRGRGARPRRQKREVGHTAKNRKRRRAAKPGS